MKSLATNQGPVKARITKALFINGKSVEIGTVVELDMPNFRALKASGQAVQVTEDSIPKGRIDRGSNAVPRTTRE